MARKTLESTENGIDPLTGEPTRFADDWEQAEEQAAMPVLHLAELIKAVRRHAMNNYNTSGWDFIVECWSDDDIGEAIFSCTTAKQAIAKVEQTARLMGEQRTGIQNS